MTGAEAKSLITIVQAMVEGDIAICDFARKNVVIVSKCTPEAIDEVVDLAMSVHPGTDWIILTQFGVLQVYERVPG